MHHFMSSSLPCCLVVDSDPESAKILAGIIASHGFEISIVPDAFAALRDLRVNRYDVIVFDLSAHDGDAEFVLDTLRRDMPRVLDKVVIVTTNPIISSDVTVGVPVVGKNDLKPLMRYLNRE
jgi:DNA-binding response OmpR family regulator